MEDVYTDCVSLNCSNLMNYYITLNFLLYQLNGVPQMQHILLEPSPYAMDDCMIISEIKHFQITERKASTGC